ncbi:uncharacterized protein si:ch73-364h19.1 [Astyanax mexicanus]|uniref:uncharacterized protein si:ch73-364h19.1 n=1 Tax=Astyanax mexicanus TaxID=7994 RepID=UPI0020CAE01C|nr:uncharacterized protein si:ch73-364h19.1 [Astyanax mexicanus]
MSTAASHTSSPAGAAAAAAAFPTDQLTIIVASFSCLVFFVVIAVLLSLIFRKDFLCCKVRTYRDSHGDLEAPSQYYRSRQTLVSSSCAELSSNTMLDSPNSQSGQLFYVGLPSTYRLPVLEPPMPRLPSYESVRKKDRQRQIHMMIADRFGLNGPMTTEPPPTYEESIRHSVQSLDVTFETLTSETAPPAQVMNTEPTEHVDDLPQYEELPQNTSNCSTSGTNDIQTPQPD